VRDAAGALVAAAALSYFGGIRAVVLLLGVVAIVAVIHYADAAPSLVRRGIICAAIVAAFIWYAETKYALISSALSPTQALTLSMLGVSYIFVRLLTLIADSVNRQAGSGNVISDVHYLLFLPALPSGPIQTRGQFHYAPIGEQWRAISLACVARATWGLTKILFIAPLIDEPAQDFDRVSLFSFAYANIAASLCLYTLYLYLNFSGTIDIVNSLARMLGYPMPENFNRPYLATSIRDFWRRWNIGLTSALRDYVFRPLVTTLSRRLNVTPRESHLVTYTGYYVTFVASALWHNFSLGFVLWGAWHATGMALSHRFGRDTWNWLPRPAELALSWAATTLFVGIGWIFFIYPSPWIAVKALYAPTASVQVINGDERSARFRVEFQCPAFADDGAIGMREGYTRGAQNWQSIPAESSAPGHYSAVISHAGTGSSTGPRLQPLVEYCFQMTCLRHGAALYAYQRCEVLKGAEP